MIAVVPVRLGAMVAGGSAAIAEAGGVGILVGEGALEVALALAELAGERSAESECRELRVLELGTFRVGRWAEAIAPHIGDRGPVILPASPDGRDLAPRLAAALGWPLLAGAIRVSGQGASLAWQGGRQIAQLRVAGPFVATLLPGSRSTLLSDELVEAGNAGSRSPASADASASVRRESGVPVLELEVLEAAAATLEDTAPGEVGAGEAGEAGPGAGTRDNGAGAFVPRRAEKAYTVVPDAELVEVVAADPAVMDLEEATRILGAGAGIGGPEQIATLQVVATALGASLGATRVVTDAGWLGHDRQIGTTGVSVRPRCYVAFAVSGAAQHVGGLGTPRHVVSVNIDPSCPMTAMADLGIVTDAQATIDVLARRLAALTAPAAGAAGDSAGALPEPGSGPAAPSETSASEHVGA